MLIVVARQVPVQCTAYQGFAKGWFPKGWFWQICPYTEILPKGLCLQCVCVCALPWQKKSYDFWHSWTPKAGTRVHSPKPSFYKTALLFPLELRKADNGNPQDMNITWRLLWGSSTRALQTAVDHQQSQAVGFCILYTDLFKQKTMTMTKIPSETTQLIMVILLLEEGRERDKDNVHGHAQDFLTRDLLHTHGHRHLKLRPDIVLSWNRPLPDHIRRPAIVRAFDSQKDIQEVLKDYPKDPSVLKIVRRSIP